MSASELDLEPLFAASRVRLAAIRERRRLAAEAAKPKVVMTVEPKMAEAIVANPKDVRLVAKGADDIPVVSRPRPTEVIQVIPDEPTVDGRLTRAWRTDCVTGERSVIEYVNGYRQPASVVHEYDPLAGLRRREDD